MRKGLVGREVIPYACRMMQDNDGRDVGPPSFIATLFVVNGGTSSIVP